MPVYVGLDCGGSSCRLLARNEHGEDLVRGQSGPANLASTPREVAQRNLTAAAAGCPAADSVCGCFAGLIGEPERQFAIETLSALFPAARIAAVPDYRAALRLCPDTDACVIAGTGSVVVSMRDGQLMKSGGRGLLIGDEGSAAQIGRRALRAYLKESADELGDAIEETFKGTEESSIIATLYSGSPAARLAKLASSAGKAAGAGNEVLQLVVVTEMDALAAIVVTHLGESRPDHPMISLAGGLWKAAPIFQTQFEQSIKTAIGPARIERLSKPAVEGAVLLAMDAHHGN